MGRPDSVDKTAPTRGLAEPGEMVVVGYPSIDHIAVLEPGMFPGKTMLVAQQWEPATFGGCAANVAVGVRRLGIASSVVFSLGTDEAGARYRAYLASEGVGLAYVQEVAGRTSSSYFFLHPEGSLELFFDPGVCRGWAPMNLRPHPADWLILTVAPLPAVEACLSIARSRKIRMAWQLKRDEDAFPSRLVPDLLRHSSMVFMNSEEAQYVCQSVGVTQEQDLLRMGPDIIVVTRGRCGCDVFAGSQRIKVPVVPAVETDPTGAGDGFTAGFLFGLAKGCTPEQAARIGSVVAAFVVEAPGAQAGLPTLPALERRYRAFWGEALPFS